MQEPDSATQPSEVKGKKGRPGSRSRKATTSETNEPPALSGPAIPSTSSASRRAGRTAGSRPQATVDKPDTGLQDVSTSQRLSPRLQGGDVQTALPPDPPRQKQDGERKARRRQTRVREAEQTGQLDLPALQPDQASSSSIAPQLGSTSASAEEPSRTKAGRQRRKPRSSSSQPEASKEQEGNTSRKRELVQPVQGPEGHVFIPLSAPPGMGKAPSQGGNGPRHLPPKALPEDGSALAPQQAAPKRVKPRSKTSGTEDVAGDYI